MIDYQRFFGPLRAAMAGLTFAACAVVMGCKAIDISKPYDIPAPDVVLSVIDGGSQDVVAGSPFPKSIRVQITEDGKPHTDLLFYDYTEPGAAVVHGTASSDVSGVAAIALKAGTTPGAYSVRAYLHLCTRRENVVNCIQSADLGTITISGRIVSP